MAGYHKFELEVKKAATKENVTAALGGAVLLVLLVAVVVSWNSEVDRLTALDYGFSDSFWSLRNEWGLGPKYESAAIEVLVVTIDSRDLAGAREKWPWSYELYNEYAGMFLENKVDTLVLDVPLRNEKVATNLDNLLDRRVVLSANVYKRRDGRMVVDPPGILATEDVSTEEFGRNWEFGSNAVDQGLDGIVRSILPARTYLLEGGDEKDTLLVLNLPVIAYTRSRHVQQMEYDPRLDVLVLDDLVVPLSDGEMVINYSFRSQEPEYGTSLAGGLWTSIPSISLTDLQALSEAELKRLIESKIVFFSLTDFSIKRHVAHPLGELTPGVHLQAELLASMLEQEFVKRYDSLTQISVLLLLGVPFCLAFPRLGQTRGLPLAVLLVAGWTAYAFYSFAYHGFLYPLLAPWLAVLLPTAVMSSYLYRVNEKDKAIIQQLFGGYLSPKVVDNLIRMKNQGELGLTGRKLKLTIFYSDIRGFTRMAEDLDPFTTVSILNEHFEHLTAEAFRFDAYVDKFIGDSLMAVLSAPTPRHDDALRSVLMALAMQEDMERLQAERAARGDPTYQIGIGIHTGPVVLGNIGSSVKMDYTVIGDVVNTTSRLCHLAKGGQILISQATYDEVRDRIEVRELEPMEVKGKSEALRLYEVLGLK